MNKCPRSRNAGASLIVIHEKTRIVVEMGVYMSRLNDIELYGHTLG